MRVSFFVRPHFLYSHSNGALALRRKALKNVRIYDNGGKTADRFTAVYMNQPEGRGLFGKKIKITPAQLTTAQVRGSTALDEGYSLTAVALDDGNWKYILSWGGQVGLVRYAAPGLDAAKWAINASEEEADEQPSNSMAPPF